MTGSGCLSRVLGPVFVSYIYTNLGTVWTFGITTVMMVLAMIWLQLVLKRIKASIYKATKGVNLRPEERKENIPLDVKT